MGAGAQGVEVTISGKIRGARSATAKFNDGYIKKCGEPSTRFVKEGFATVQLKPGVLGIYVRIMPPGMILPDKVDILKAAVEEPAVDTIMDTLETEEAEEPQAEEIEDTELSEIEVEEEPAEDSIIEAEEETAEEPSEATEEDKEETPEESEETEDKETTEEPENTEEAENKEENSKEASEESEKPE